MKIQIIAMITLLILFASSVSTVLAANDHLVISQVLYDPVISETGGEAVELFNPTAQAVNLDGYVIKTESSDTDAVLPAVMLEPNEYFLVADVGWSTNKDNDSWPDADHEEALTMSNSDAGVALVFNGTNVDAVGWGSAAGIDPGLYEGTPADSVVSGLVLKRLDIYSDTEDNSVDFIESVGNFLHEAASQENETQENETNQSNTTNETGSDIDVEVNITNTAPQILELTMPDQLTPLPAANQTIELSVLVSDSNGADDIVMVAAYLYGPSPVTDSATTLTFAESINSTTDRFEGSFMLPFWWQAGEYTIEFIVNDSSASDSTNANFDYLNMTAIEIDVASIGFTGASPGSATELLGDTDLETQNPTIRNIGNTALDIGIYAEDLVSESGSISVDNLKYSFDNDFESTLAGTLTTDTQLVEISLTPAELSLMSLGLQLTVPQSTLSGHYSGQTTIVAVSE